MTLMRSARYAVLSALLFVAWPAWSASGTMLREDKLRAAASATAAVLAKVPKGASVEVLARQGGWLRIRASGKTGWVRMLSVRTRASAQRDVGGELAGLVGMGTQQADSSRVVSVAGVRGLSPQDLQTAQFDAKELARLDRYAVSLTDAQVFAREGGLAAQRVDYLPAPAQAKQSPWEELQW